jgi:PAS domain S-box-containing protein
MPELPERISPDPVLHRLFAEYLEMYATRDDRLTTRFSENFSGFAGGGHVLVKDRAEWVAVTRQDFAQVREPLRIDVKDVSYQSLSDTVAVATGFLTLHLPIKDHILSRETARLVLIFHCESGDWKISHSSISIPYHLVREGEVYPLHELEDRNRHLEELAAERTKQLSEANDRLRRSEERYRSILQASPDDITITDREGRIVMVSPAAATIFRCEPMERFLGLPVMDFIVPEDRARAMSRAMLRQQGRIVGPSEYLGLRPDGSTFPIEVNSDFIRDDAGTPTGMVVIVRDITERKQAEAEREKLAAQNRQLQKAESLGRMAGAVAHHFNNQLHAVMMSLELALGGLPPDSPALANVTLARQSARKAAELSAQMLTYLGQTTATPFDLDLADLCRRSLPLLHAVLPHRVRLTIDLPTAGPVIHADANQIQHVLTNLITNAWEACDTTGGTVRLAVTTVSRTEIPTARRFPVGSRLDAATYACLAITDTGSGIPEADIEKIFDPFFSRKFPGRGMGLAVALGVTRAHGGAIAVESAPGRGSTFRVFLPTAPSGA